MRAESLGDGGAILGADEFEINFADLWAELQQVMTRDAPLGDLAASRLKSGRDGIRHGY
jgi:hypothetical protein